MGVVTLKSGLITKFDATPPTMATSRQNGGYLEGQNAYASKAAGDSATSIYRLLRLHSSWAIKFLEILTGASGASGTINVGFYQTPANGGAYVHKTLLGSALDNSAVFKSNVASLGSNPEELDKQLWERLALSADSNRYYDLVVELQHAGAGNAIKIGANCMYQR